MDAGPGDLSQGSGDLFLVGSSRPCCQHPLVPPHPGEAGDLRGRGSSLLLSRRHRPCWDRGGGRVASGVDSDHLVRSLRQDGNQGHQGSKSEERSRQLD